MKTPSERYQWFLDRIGKKVFRNKTSCKCGVCAYVYEYGTIILDELDADFLYCMEFDAPRGEIQDIKYFDTKEEAINFEKINQ